MSFGLDLVLSGCLVYYQQSVLSRCVFMKKQPNLEYVHVCVCVIEI